jgi:hypothetical protein
MMAPPIYTNTSKGHYYVKKIGLALLLLSNLSYADELGVTLYSGKNQTGNQLRIPIG